VLLCVSIGAAVSVDPAFYDRQIKDIKHCKVSDQLVVGCVHVQQDARWEATVQETMVATGPRFPSICVRANHGRRTHDFFLRR
jgi:hypothetical protein